MFTDTAGDRIDGYRVHVLREAVQEMPDVSDAQCGGELLYGVCDGLLHVVHSDAGFPGARMPLERALPRADADLLEQPAACQMPGAYGAAVLA